MRLAQFLEYLEDRTGDSLRAVEWYRGDEDELIYLRDDLDLGDVQQRAEEIHDNITWDSDRMGESVMEELGPELATVSLREDAVLVHLPVEPDAGVVIGLGPESASSLHRFVIECREALSDLVQPGG